jgi:superfamily II DNA or RNA helicase
MKEIAILKSSSFSQIVPSNTPHYLELSEILSVQVKTEKELYFLKSKYPHLRDWDGKARFIKYPECTFPVGLTDYLVETLNKSEDWSVTVEEEYPNVVVSEDYLSSLKPDEILQDFCFRDYQLQILKDVLQAKRCLLPAATNAGKTEMFAGVMVALLRYAPTNPEFLEVYPNPRVIMFVPSADLMVQTVARLKKRIGDEFSVGGFGAKSFDLSCDITVATVSMLHARMKKPDWKSKIKDLYKNTILFVGDEFHHGSAKTWLDQSSQINAVFRVGGSGTVKSKDKEKDFKIMGCCGPEITGVTNDFMIERGFSAKPTIRIQDYESYDRDYDRLPYQHIDETEAYWYNGEDFEDVVYVMKELAPKIDKKTKKAVYHPVTKKMIQTKTGKSIIRNSSGEEFAVSPDVLLNKEHAYEMGVCLFKPRNNDILDYCTQYSEQGLKILICVNKPAHGILLSNLLNDNDIRSKFVYGAHSVEERTQALKDISAGKLDVLIASTIFNEGVDTPDFRIVINAAGGKDHKALLQKVGRGLRKKEGDNTVIIHDFVDSQNVYTLEHSIARVEEYENQKFDIEYL